MTEIQQKQNIAIVLCDDHSHGQLEKILTEKWFPKNVPVHTGWEAVLPAGGTQPAVTHCLVVAVMSALLDETLQHAVEGVKALLAKGCKAGMVLVEPFGFEEAGKELATRLLEQLEDSALDFVETRSMDDYAKAGGQPKGFMEFFDAVYFDIAETSARVVEKEWGGMV
ncbi:MAG: hypothetical protein J6T33_01965 [Bacteroidales bacterium]|nr:hypothetical protein [Bacteroidales bacterium]